jgi:hypothetical protein
MKQIKKLSPHCQDRLYSIDEDICDLVLDQLSIDPETEDMPELDDLELSDDDIKEIAHLILMITNRAKRRILERNTNK